MNASNLRTRTTIEIRLSGTQFIESVLPYCKEELLTSDIHSEFCKAFKKDSASVVKYNQLAIKTFMASVLDFRYSDDMIRAIVELCITKAIIIDCQL